MPVFTMVHTSEPERRALVRRFRRGRGWTQAVAASWWGCSERQWRRYENGQTPPPVPLIKRIARGAQNQ